jgi:toxin-antitoxin system PIN domain toxin
MLAVDTNFLIYAHRREAPEYPIASKRLRDLVESRSWAIPWPCLYEFFSVVTNPRIWKEKASRPEEAWAQVAAWSASPGVRLLGETEGYLEVLARLARRPRVRGPVIHDARVAALCLVHGVGVLLSRDRDFSHFPELKVENPFV